MKHWHSDRPAKVFFVGFHKTGTGYYNTIFRELGFRSLHHWKWRRANPFVLKRYDVFLDGCLHRYDKILKRYPDAHFVLNTRGLQDWLVSRMKYDQERYGHLPRWCLYVMNIYHRYAWGNDCYFNLELVKRWILERQDYHRDVMQFFEKKQKSLLILDIKDELKLDKLFEYLELPRERLADFKPSRKENQSAVDPRKVEEYERLAAQAVRQLNLPMNTLDQIL